MSPSRVTLGIICAVAVAAGRRVYALAAAVVLSVALMACTATPVSAPSDPPVSALQIYEAARAETWPEAYAAGRADERARWPDRSRFRLSKSDLEECNRNKPWMNTHGAVAQDTAIWSNEKARKQINACADKNDHKAALLREWAGSINRDQ